MRPQRRGFHIGNEILTAFVRTLKLIKLLWLPKQLFLIKTKRPDCQPQHFPLLQVRKDSRNGANVWCRWISVLGSLNKNAVWYLGVDGEQTAPKKLGTKNMISIKSMMTKRFKGWAQSPVQFCLYRHQHQPVTPTPQLSNKGYSVSVRVPDEGELTTWDDAHESAMTHTL